MCICEGGGQGGGNASQTLGPREEKAPSGSIIERKDIRSFSLSPVAFYYPLSLSYPLSSLSRPL